MGAVVGVALFAWPSSAVQGAGAQAEQGNLRFEGERGRAIALADFRGRAVLLNVWATWCPPCREEMPSLDRLEAARGGDKFEVVALSIDKGGAKQVEPFFREVGIERLRMYLDQPGAAMGALGIVGLPTTLLIAPDGRELKRWVGPKEWDKPETVREIDVLLAEAALS